MGQGRNSVRASNGTVLSLPISMAPQDPWNDDAPLVDPGRSLGLRVLALLGAASFVMLGISSVVVPLLQTPEPPPPLPDQRGRSA